MISYLWDKMKHSKKTINGPRHQNWRVEIESRLRESGEERGLKILLYEVRFPLNDICLKL